MSDQHPQAATHVEPRAAAISAALLAIPGHTPAIHRLRDRLSRLLDAPELVRFGPMVLLSPPGPTRSAVLDAVAVAAGRLRQAIWHPAPIQRFAAASLPALLHHERLFGVDKVAAPGGETLHGLLESAEAGVAVIEDAESLEPVAARALADAIGTRSFRRRGDSRDRALAARVVLVVSSAESLERVEPTLRALFPAAPLAVPPLADRLADLGDLLAAVGLEALDADRLAAVAAHVTTQRPADQERAALVAGADPELLDAARTPASHEFGTAPALMVPRAIADGSATLEQVKAWYIQHVRAQALTDVDAARRLDVHRATIAKYVRPEP